MSAQSKLTAARTVLVLDQPFFGALALNLVPREDTACDTAWTDGKHLGYNPTFIESLTHAEIVGLCAHEVMHCAMGHPWRRDAREMGNWNAACDYAINGELQGAGFTLPADGLMPDASQRGKSAEWIYGRLPQPKPNGGKSKPDPLGEVRDAPTGPDSDGNPAPTEGEWKQRTAEAYQAAKMQGTVSGGIARLAEQALDKRIDVKSLLLRFFSERAKADFSWTRPSSRYIHMGIYLPSLDSVSMGEVAVLVDTSGSTSSQALQFARGILEQVLDEVQPAGVTLYFVDTQIHGTHRMERGDPLTWEPKGGGGTSFASFFATPLEIEPVCIVAISDLYADFGSVIPSVPVIWLTDTEGKEAPFGETVFIDR